MDRYFNSSSYISFNFDQLNKLTMYFYCKGRRQSRASFLMLYCATEFLPIFLCVTLGRRHSVWKVMHPCVFSFGILVACL